jgi:hypothetical protein
MRETYRENLKEHVVEVTFTKVNGEQRVMQCTLRPDLIPAATKDDAITQKKVRELNEEVMSVWDINAQGWRSFRVANVTQWIVT